jgi:hypothetical protein
VYLCGVCPASGEHSCRRCTSCVRMPVRIFRHVMSCASGVAGTTESAEVLRCCDTFLTPSQGRLACCWACHQGSQADLHPDVGRSGYPCSHPGQQQAALSILHAGVVHLTPAPPRPPFPCLCGFVGSSADGMCMLHRGRTRPRLFGGWAAGLLCCKAAWHLPEFLSMHACMRRPCACMRAQATGLK